MYHKVMSIISLFHKLLKCFRIGTLRPLVRLAIFRWRVLYVKKNKKYTTLIPTHCISCTKKTNNIEVSPVQNAPLVSVIIPCFNYGRYILEAVNSILAQSYQFTEICIIDGGSTDKTTLDVLKTISHPKISILYQDTPTFVGKNRNTGIASTRGKYICCLDADDRLLPTYLEKTINVLEQECADVVSSGYQVLGYPERVFLNMPFPLLEDLLLGNHVLTCGVFRRSFFEKTEGYVDSGKGSMHIAEDWRLWVHMAALGARFYSIPEPLLEYRIHGEDSLSRQIGVPPLWKQADAIYEALEELLSNQALDMSRLNSHKRFSLCKKTASLI